MTNEQWEQRYRATVRATAGGAPLRWYTRREVFAEFLRMPRVYWRIYRWQLPLKLVRGH